MTACGCFRPDVIWIPPTPAWTPRRGGRSSAAALLHCRLAAFAGAGDRDCSSRLKAYCIGFVPAVTLRPRLWRKDAPSRGRGSGWSGTALMGEVPNCRHCPSRARGKNVQPGVANIRERERNFYNCLTGARDNVDNVRHKAVDVIRAQSGGVGGGFCF